MGTVEDGDKFHGNGWEIGVADKYPSPCSSLGLNTHGCGSKRLQKVVCSLRFSGSDKT